MRAKVLDTDSLPSALVLAAFLLLFSCLSLVQHRLTPTTLSLRSTSQRWTSTAIPLLKYACVIAVAVSGLAQKLVALEEEVIVLLGALELE